MVKDKGVKVYSVLKKKEMKTRIQRAS